MADSANSHEGHHRAIHPSESELIFSASRDVRTKASDSRGTILVYPSSLATFTENVKLRHHPGKHFFVDRPKFSGKRNISTPSGRGTGKGTSAGNQLKVSSSRANGVPSSIINSLSAPNQESRSL